MKKIELPDERDLVALRHRAKTAIQADQPVVKVKAATVASLVECSLLAIRMVEAARREVAVNSCWCRNWHDAQPPCSWCRLKKLVDMVPEPVPGHDEP